MVRGTRRSTQSQAGERRSLSAVETSRGLIGSPHNIILQLGGVQASPHCARVAPNHVKTRSFPSEHSNQPTPLLRTGWVERFLPPPPPPPPPSSPVAFQRATGTRHISIVRAAGAGESFHPARASLLSRHPSGMMPLVLVHRPVMLIQCRREVMGPVVAGHEIEVLGRGWIQSGPD